MMRDLARTIAFLTLFAGAFVGLISFAVGVAIVIYNVAGLGLIVGLAVIGCGIASFCIISTTACVLGLLASIDEKLDVSPKLKSLSKDKVNVRSDKSDLYLDEGVDVGEGDDSAIAFNSRFS